MILLLLHSAMFGSSYNAVLIECLYSQWLRRAKQEDCKFKPFLGKLARLSQKNFLKCCSAVYWDNSDSSPNLKGLTLSPFQALCQGLPNFCQVQLNQIMHGGDEGDSVEGSDAEWRSWWVCYCKCSFCGTPRERWRPWVLSQGHTSATGPSLKLWQWEEQNVPEKGHLKSWQSI